MSTLIVGEQAILLRVAEPLKYIRRQPLSVKSMIGPEVFMCYTVSFQFERESSVFVSLHAKRVTSPEKTCTAKAPDRALML